MKLAIDCRLCFQTGVGRYIRAILQELKKKAACFPENQYVLIVLEEDKEKFLGFPNNVKIIGVKARWHSFAEQIKIPLLLDREKPDLVHFPYFNVPFLYFGKFIVTIHDLTLHKFKTGKATTLPSWLFFLKKQFYFLIFSWAVTRAAKILTVSKVVKNEIIKKYQIEEHKIATIYNGADLESSPTEVAFFERATKKSPLAQGKFLLYVGNLHPHKNVETLILAFEKLIKNAKFTDLKLVIVSPPDFFWQRMLNMVKKMGLEKAVFFPGVINNAGLAVLYRRAVCFVFPSLSEGFGIPGVEAMSCRCPVVASDILVFHEIYQDACLYFQPQNAFDLQEKLEKLLEEDSLRQELIRKGLIQSSLFSWNKTAKEIFHIYESCVNI